MAGKLKGKVAVISGGATGMGRAAARLFAAEGAKVAVVDRNVEAGEATVAAILANGDQAAFFAADVAEEAQVNAAVAAACERFGAATVLFNHAGTIVIKPFLETTLADWERLHAMNVRSMFLMTRAVIPHMIASRRRRDRLHLLRFRRRRDADGSALRHDQRRLPYVRPRDRGGVPRPEYSLQRCLPGLHPHPARTARGRRIQRLGVDVSDAAIAAQQGRIGEPEEVARAALYLASDEASFVNGAHLFVDNGFTAA